MSNSWQSSLRRTRSNTETRSISVDRLGQPTSSQENVLLRQRFEDERQQRMESVARKNELDLLRQRFEEEQQHRDKFEQENILLRRRIDEESQRKTQLQEQLDHVGRKVNDLVALKNTSSVPSVSVPISRTLIR